MHRSRNDHYRLHSPLNETVSYRATRYETVSFRATPFAALPLSAVSGGSAARSREAECQRGDALRSADSRAQSLPQPTVRGHHQPFAVWVAATWSTIASSPEPRALHHPSVAGPSSALRAFPSRTAVTEASDQILRPWLSRPAGPETTWLARPCQRLKSFVVEPARSRHQPFGVAPSTFAVSMSKLRAFARNVGQVWPNPGCRARARSASDKAASATRAFRHSQRFQTAPACVRSRWYRSSHRGRRPTRDGWSTASRDRCHLPRLLREVRPQVSTRGCRVPRPGIPQVSPW